jgi:hypothetical protein
MRLMTELCSGETLYLLSGYEPVLLRRDYKGRSRSLVPHIDMPVKFRGVYPCRDGTPILTLIPAGNSISN